MPKTIRPESDTVSSAAFMFMPSGAACYEEFCLMTTRKDFSCEHVWKIDKKFQIIQP